MEAVFDHGVVPVDSITNRYEEANMILLAVAACGVDYDDVTELLEREGVEKFIVSWNELLESVTGALASAK
jgi:transaldolase